MKIGLDIDDVLGDFIGQYCRYFDCDSHPERLRNEIITRNVQRILRKDREFWINLPVLNMPDFIPTLYCTKRVNPKLWTKIWLKENNFPNSPVYQLFCQSANKARMIKGRVDVFIDDSEFNVRQLLSAGVPALLFGRTSSDLVSINSLQLDEISQAYKSLQEWISR